MHDKKNKPGTTLRGLETKIRSLEKQIVRLKESLRICRKTHKELENSDAKLRLLFKTAPERIINTDLKGRILYMNYASTRNVKDIIGKHINQFIIPEERKKIKQIMDSVTQSGKKKSYEAHFIDPDGKKLFFDCTASPIKKDGQVSEILIIAANITEQKEAEAALKESEAKFRTLAEQSPNMIFIIAGDRIVYINKKCEEVMGFTKEDYYSGKVNLFQSIAPDSFEKAKKSYEKHLTGQEIPSYEYSLRTKNGDRIEAIITSRQIQYGGETATLGVITDITERKRAESALRKDHDVLEQRVKERTNELMAANLRMKQEIEERKQAERTLEERERMQRIILDSSPDAITMTDGSGTIMECNQSCIDMLGYDSKEELMGKSAFDLIVKKEQSLALKNLQQTLAKGAVKNIEYTHVKKDRTEFPCEMSASVVHDASGKAAGFVAVTKDISARKRAEQALKKSEAELRKQKLALEEKNIALREIIAQIEIEKRKIEEDVIINVELVFSPILDRLKEKQCDFEYINLLQHHLKSLTSSFGSKIMDKTLNLTPREIEICNMIKGGMTSKDISKLLNISPQTVERHRKNIRHKLGIANRRVNLTRYLRQL